MQLLALKTEGGREPRNAGALGSWTTQRKSSPQSLQEGRCPANSFAFRLLPRRTVR